MPGINEENITVNLERDAFTVGYDSALITVEGMYEAIFELGYSPGLQPPDDSSTQTSEDTASSPVEAALITAAEEHKLVLIDFSAEWCIACKALEEQVLTDSSVIEALQDYVFVNIDTDEFPDAAKAYDVVGMPTLVVLHPNGDELYRNVGFITPDEFSQALRDLVPK